MTLRGLLTWPPWAVAPRKMADMPVPTSPTSLRQFPADRRRWLRNVAGALAGVAVLTASAWAASPDDQGPGTGRVLLMRHATAPGVGDPAEFRLGDCSTQRNLSGAGRQQAREIGERLRSAGWGGVPVYSSPWCRCVDTARLIGLGEVTELPVLGSSFAGNASDVNGVGALRRWLAGQGGKPSVLVTHQVNITALTGVYPASGEVLLLKVSGDDVQVLGRWPDGQASR